MSGVGHVSVQLAWADLQSAEDPHAYVAQQAERALRYNHRYSDSEVRFVTQDPLFRQSCEHAYRRCRKLAEKRWARDQRLWKHGQEISQQPLEWRLGIKFHRPGTRGFADREI